MKTSYLINDFDSLNLPQSPSYELACTICDETELSHWQPLIEQLCQKHSLSMVAKARASSGENPTFLLQGSQDAQYYIKFIAPNWLFQYHNETLALTQCQQASLPIATPKIIAHGLVNGWGYILTKALPGQLLSEIYDDLNSVERSAIASQLGRFCLQLHSVPMSKDNALFIDWPSFIKAQYHNSYARRKRQGLRADLLADFIPYISHTPYRAPESHQLHLIHSDLHPGNLLVEGEGKAIRISGVIDFGDALICNEPVFEFTTVGLLIAKGNAGVFASFLESYLYEIENHQAFINSLMTLTLLRHTGSLNYLIEHVPNVQACSSWHAIAPHFFPLEER